MDELKKRLARELQQDFNVKILDSLVWHVPVHSIDISYQTEKRTKMDVLMKMILIVLQKLTTATIEELSDILLVEPLFVEGILAKMTRTQMVEKSSTSFTLMDRGKERLDEEVFIHEPETDSKTALYSLCHQSFLNGNVANLTEEAREVFRYADEFNDWAVESLEKNKIKSALQFLNVESAEGNVQIVISEILSVVDTQTDWSPCLEFRLYNKAEDLLYARVWNTMTEHWDETLEMQLNEKERKQWREDYLNK
ncbi:hypothetical protein [Sporosarcina sp. HYO08]|uniref:hypothetical protein n=1 Tax=Sporosarcina sp. HYO08 TaxID=1759557 RepID=UPI00079AB76E|nr:hypothetical protein [Sporosarcina sp. HYO08]KXH81949.1 hypothetical protein AU377_06735 [Sporosarcina sp. HYO08]